jgi:hypothetical protein
LLAATLLTLDGDGYRSQVDAAVSATVSAVRAELPTNDTDPAGCAGFCFDSDLDPGYVANAQTPILRVAWGLAEPAALDVADGGGLVSQRDALAAAAVVLLVVELMSRAGRTPEFRSWRISGPRPPPPVGPAPVIPRYSAGPPRTTASVAKGSRTWVAVF